MASTAKAQKLNWLLPAADRGHQSVRFGTDGRPEPEPSSVVLFRKEGGMLNEKLALMYDGAAVSSADPAVTASVGTFAVQYWMGQRGWIKGGAGLGTLSDDFETQTGLALMGSAGVELVQKRKFVLDLQGRVATTKFEFLRINMFMVSLGFNWY